MKLRLGEIRNGMHVAAWVALVFGIITIREGGSVLFYDGAARQAAGHYVPFVLWFNFLAGFAYVVAGVGLWYRRVWGAILTFAIAAATVAVFLAFGVHVARGGAYEMRTIIAMSARSLVWLLLSAAAYRGIWSVHPLSFHDTAQARARGGVTAPAD